MGRAACDGIVDELRRQSVQFTGKSYVDGKHRRRDELRREVQRHGGVPVADSSRNRSMTLLVLGELRDNVVDPSHHMSKQLRYVARERASGNHICVVDSDGLSILLRGLSAPCLELREAPGSLVHLSLPEQRIILGGLVRPHSAPSHEAVEITHDLSDLDRGTAAHELTVVALRERLTPLSARQPGPGAPRFDLGWESADGKLIFVAEVKSLPMGAQDQQIRLGVGQVLDYAHSVRMMRGASQLTVIPVLVLERKPSDPRWSAVAQEVGMMLTWAPDFPGI